MRRTTPRRPGELNTLRESLYRLVDLVLNHGWIVLVVAIVAELVAVLLLAAGGLVPEQEQTTRWTLFWWGVGFAVVGVAATSGLEKQRRWQHRERAKESLESQMLAAETVGPVVKRLLKLMQKPSSDHASQLALVIGTVLEADRRIFEHIESSRMVFYEYEPAKGARKPRLSPVNWSGKSRPAEPKPFTMADARGRSAINWAETADQPKFIADVELESDPGWQGSGNGYRTFISAPVRVGEALKGMITIDAKEPGDLDETDKPTIALLADLLALAYARRY
ncbi:GAF domain-containing protein [Agrococcus sp. DT81.2]|uniref:GAF domain-containing protein n=1 Tax=Agrococcus sp. DT81.2 TaxID=3393414 RepID=UPI003CE54E99